MQPGAHIECHEPSFLRGSRETLSADRPALFLEINQSCLARHAPGLTTFADLLPAGYKMLRPEDRRGRRWRRFHRFAECRPSP
jgi:hypothetical protein